MLPGDSGNRIYYKSMNKWAIDTNNTERLEVSDGGVTIVNDLAVSGKTTITNDIDAAGGFAQSFVFVNNNLLQGGFPRMSASVGWVTASLPNPEVFCEIPMCRNGSIRGLVLSVRDSTQTIKSGALSASVTLNGFNVACTAVGHTGTYIVKTLAKDSVTFTAGQRLGVSLSASALYLSEPGITSASFIATVLVEM